MSLCTYPICPSTLFYYFTGASGSVSARPRKRRGVPFVEDEILEHDEVLPRATTARGVSIANKKKGNKTPESLAKMRLHEYTAIRTINPYVAPRVLIFSSEVRFGRIWASQVPTSPIAHCLILTPHS